MNELALQQYLLAQYPKENAACEWKEFKRLRHAVSGAKGDDIISYISAIANMEGGHLVVGVEDGSLHIVGIQDFHDYTLGNIRLRLLGKCVNLNSEGLRVEAHTTDDTSKTVWIFHIPKHRPRLPVYAHDKAWQRVDDSLVEIRPERQDAILAERVEAVLDHAGEAASDKLLGSSIPQDSHQDEFGRIFIDAQRTSIIKTPFSVNASLAVGFCAFALSAITNISGVASSLPTLPQPVAAISSFILFMTLPFSGLLIMLGISLKLHSASLGVAFFGNVERGKDDVIYLSRVKANCPFCPGKMRMLGASKHNKDHTLICNRNSEHRVVFDMTTLPDVAEDYNWRSATA